MEIEEPKEYICESYYYLINGKKYWRVTQVKSVLNQAGLNAWRARVGNSEANKIMHARQNLGTKVHKLFELILDNNKVNPNNYKSEEVKQDIENMNILIDDCKFEPLMLEQRLWNDELSIAGTADYIGKYKSNKKYLKKKEEPRFNKVSLVVGDWKTSSGIFKDYWLQLSAYVYMFWKLTGVKPEGAFIAQFRNDKVNIEERTFDELMLYFEAFKHCIECFEYQRKQGKYENII